MDAPSLSYRRFVDNVLAGAGGRLAAILLALTLATVLVRTLGVAAYGTWSFFFVLLGFHAQLDLGLSVAIERGVARAVSDGRRARVPILLNAGLAIAVALSALLQLLLAAIPQAWLVVLGDVDTVRRCLIVLPACLACSNAAAVAGAGLAGLQQTTTLVRQRTVTGAVGTLVIAALALAGLRRLDLLLVLYAATLLVTAILSWRAVARAIGPVPLRPWHPEPGALRELAGFGGVLQLTTVVAQLGDQALRVVLGARFGPAAIGTYDLASRAAMAPRSLMASLLVALVPFAAGREQQGGSAALSDALQRSTRYAMLVLLAGTAAGLAVAGPLMLVWLGDATATAAETQRLFELLLVSLAVQSIASPMVALARAAGQPRPEALVTLAAQPAAVALAWAAPTPVLAVSGAAVVLMASAAVLWTWLKVSLGLRGLSVDELARLGAVAAAVGFVAWGARQLSEAWAPSPWVPLLLVPPAVAAMTAALAVAWNGVSAEERQVLGRLIPGRHRCP